MPILYTSPVINRSQADERARVADRSRESKKAMIAVIMTGGKQYIVSEGQELDVELLELEVGKAIVFEAMLVADSDGKNVKIGAPHVTGATVSATVVEHGKDEKVHVIKYKPKVRYRRNVGHRQPFTKLKIEKISA